MFHSSSHELEYERPPPGSEVVERAVPPPWPLTELAAVGVILLASVGLGCVSWWISLHP